MRPQQLREHHFDCGTNLQGEGTCDLAMPEKEKKRSKKRAGDAAAEVNAPPRTHARCCRGKCGLRVRPGSVRAGAGAPGVLTNTDAGRRQAAAAADEEPVEAPPKKHKAKKDKSAAAVEGAAAALGQVLCA